MKFLRNIWKKSIRSGKFSGGIGTSEIKEHSIVIHNYPFEPSTIYPDSEIKAHEIDEIHLDCYPPTLKLKDELIFISRDAFEKLKGFADRNRIKTTKRATNWIWITEPFLDTEYNDEQKEQTRQLLRSNGISEIEIEVLRKEIAKQMYKYNFNTMLWEWGMLGLHDVLSAMEPKYNKEAFRKFYWKAMEIEQRNKSS